MVLMVKDNEFTKSESGSGLEESQVAPTLHLVEGDPEEVHITSTDSESEDETGPHVTEVLNITNPGEEMEEEFTFTDSEVEEDLEPKQLLPVSEISNASSQDDASISLTDRKSGGDTDTLPLVKGIKAGNILVKSNKDKVTPLATCEPTVITFTTNPTGDTEEEFTFTDSEAEDETESLVQPVTKAENLLVKPNEDKLIPVTTCKPTVINFTTKPTEDMEEEFTFADSEAEEETESLVQPVTKAEEDLLVKPNEDKLIPVTTCKPTVINFTTKPTEDMEEDSEAEDEPESLVQPVTQTENLFVKPNEDKVTPPKSCETPFITLTKKPAERIEEFTFTDSESEDVNESLSRPVTKTKNILEQDNGEQVTPLATCEPTVITLTTKPVEDKEEEFTFTDSEAEEQTESLVQPVTKTEDLFVKPNEARVTPLATCKPTVITLTTNPTGDIEEEFTFTDSKAEDETEPSVQPVTKAENLIVKSNDDKVILVTTCNPTVINLTAKPVGDMEEEFTFTDSEAEDETESLVQPVTKAENLVKPNEDKLIPVTTCKPSVINFTTKPAEDKKEEFTFTDSEAEDETQSLVQPVTQTESIFVKPNENKVTPPKSCEPPFITLTKKPAERIEEFTFTDSESEDVNEALSRPVTKTKNILGQHNGDQVTALAKCEPTVITLTTNPAKYKEEEFTFTDSEAEEETESLVQPVTQTESLLVKQNEDKVTRSKSCEPLFITLKTKPAEGIEEEFTFMDSEAEDQMNLQKILSVVDSNESQDDELTTVTSCEYKSEIEMLTQASGKTENASAKPNDDDIIPPSNCELMEEIAPEISPKLPSLPQVISFRTYPGEILDCRCIKNYAPEYGFKNHYRSPNPDPAIMQGNLVHEFIIRNSTRPGQFYLKNTAQLEELQALEEDMTEWYDEFVYNRMAEEEGKPRTLEIKIEPKGYYAAYISDQHTWTRCFVDELIYGFGSGNEVLVQLLDHGTTQMVGRKHILPLREEYIGFPIQVYLGWVNTTLEPKIETENDLKEFHEKTESKVFNMSIVEGDANIKPFPLLNVLFANK